MTGAPQNAAGDRPRSGTSHAQRRVAVVGAGVIGLAIAWRCAQRGLRVSLHDPEPDSGASYVAAGMLAPVNESHFGERHLSDLLVESARRWPGFAAELATATGADLGYDTHGTLTVALTADDLAEADRLRAYHSGLGLPVEALRPAALREREPALSPRMRGGAYAPGDHQVDPRRLVAALRTAVTDLGVPLLSEPPQAMDTTVDVTVIAAGCGAAALTDLPIRPVKGQILRLRAPGGRPGFRHVIRGHADGRAVYLVPRHDGEVVIGATVEERTDRAVTAGVVLDLLRAATDLVPEVAESELVESAVGHRPATPDNMPVLGPLPGRPGTVVAAGHYRHGIVLTPVTADLIADLITTGVPDPLMAPFGVDRPGLSTARPGLSTAGLGSPAGDLSQAGGPGTAALPASEALA